MADNPMDKSLNKMNQETNKAEKSVSKLDSTIIKLGDSLDSVYNSIGKNINKVNLLGSVVSKTSKGIEKVVEKFEYFSEGLKGIFELTSFKGLSGQVDSQVTKVSENVIHQVDNMTKSAKESAKVFEDLFKKTSGFSATEKKTLKANDMQVPSNRGLVGYKGIKDSAELVTSETKKLADGTKQLIETFRITNEEGTTTYKAINKKIVDIKQNLAKIDDEQDKTNKKTSKFGILLERIKRIAVYRMIRAGLRLITQTFTTSISNLAQFDESVNKNVSTMTSAFTMLQNSVSVALYPILDSLAPFIENISYKIANFASQLSLANAQLRGQGTYLAVNEDYWKDYAKSIEQANQRLFSFDKFEVLQQGDKADISEMFERKEVDGTEEVSDNVMNLAKILNQLDPILTSIWNTGTKIYRDIIEPILPDLMEIIRLVIDGVSWLIEVLDKTGLLEGAIYAIVGIGIISKITKVFDGLSKINGVLGLIGAGIAVLNIKSIIEQWDSWNESSKTLAIGIGVLTALFASLAVAILMASKKYAKALTVGGIILGTGSTVALGVGNLVSGGYENGGIPPKSELFYMNEYGKPEAMVSIGGQTNVINQDQLRFITKEGFKEAIYETGLLEAMSERLIVEGRNIDNSTVARGLFNALKVESTRRGGNQL